MSQSIATQHLVDEDIDFRQPFVVDAGEAHTYSTPSTLSRFFSLDDLRWVGIGLILLSPHIIATFL